MHGSLGMSASIGRYQIENVFLEANIMLFIDKAIRKHPESDLYDCDGSIIRT